MRKDGFADTDSFACLAGTIGAIGGNDRGISSVMNDASFYIAKGMKDDGTGPTSDVLAAVDACVANGAKVINLSIGCSNNCYSLIAAQTYKEVYDQGVLIVSSSGNAGSSAFSYPASYDNVMSVTAVDSSENKYSDAQYNAQVEIAAPGVDVLVSTLQESFGTNFATIKESHFGVSD